MCVGWEIFKMYEELVCGNVVDVLKYFIEKLLKGEIVLMLRIVYVKD